LEKGVHIRELAKKEVILYEKQEKVKKRVYIFGEKIWEI